MVVDLAAATLGSAKRYYYNKKKKHLSGAGNPRALYPEACCLIIRLPSSAMWKICHRLLLLAFVVASFPWIGSSFLGSSIPDSTSIAQQSMPDSTVEPSFDSANLDQILSVFFRDLTNEGIMKKTQQKAVFLSNFGNNERGSQIFADYDMDLVPLNDLEKQNSFLDDTVDFIFTTNFPAASRFIDRTLKAGGVATFLLNENPSASLYKLSSYKITYMRRFDSIAVALKKTEEAIAGEAKFGVHRKLCWYAPEAKKAALQNLEDVLLEPPRASSGKSRKYLKRTRYLPDLMGDSLESYPRRVFIDVGLPEKDGGSGTDWFRMNYPTRNKNFEMYKIETITEGSSGKEVTQIEMSDWLRKNVKDEEYVVMKAEAEVVEEMMRSKAIMLVDELFLECKPQSSKQGNRSRRAYWECLALYGKLRDEGVAVHQWWG